MADLTVSVIGAGSIGQPVIDYVEATEGLSRGAVLTRSGHIGTADPQLFLAMPADIIIDAAGPDALRTHGRAALGVADLWTVGGGALADDAFRTMLEERARQTGHCIRLFSHWIAGADHAAPDNDARLHIRQWRPGAEWSGTLQDAVAAYPNTVNSAVSAALCGVELDATTFELCDPGPKGGHRFEALLETNFGRFKTDIDLGNPEKSGVHPTAAALIAALRRELSPIRYG